MVVCSYERGRRLAEAAAGGAVAALTQGVKEEDEETSARAPSPLRRGGTP